MREWYLEPDQLPTLDPAAYDTPQAFLSALTESVDLAPSSNTEARDRFSVVSELRVEQNRVNNIFSGFGLLMQVEAGDSGRVLRILDVFGSFPGEAVSPASAAGLVRGDAIEQYDGENVEDAFDLDRLMGLKFIFGFDVGETHRLNVRKLDGTLVEQDITAAELMPTSVPVFKIFERGAETYGYVLFRDFDFASVEGLRKAFDLFAERGVTKLIVDQRYNLGGFVFVADYLANLMLGNDLGGQEIIQRAETWNAMKSEQFDELSFFATASCPGFLADGDFACQGEVSGLSGLTRVAFINSSNTASASELILNSMRSHVDVGVVGGRSVGKPVGSAPFPGFATGEDSFCGLVLRPTTFRNVNAGNEGDYFRGFVPDCPAPDDASAPLGDETEASVAAALQYLETGSCPQDAGTGGGLTAEPVGRRILLDAERIYGYENSLARLRDEGLLYRKK